ncbi:protein CBFA2T1-like [Stegostoma tigrinum]|uniref:protein CBFA2T1-like n=1 Tax=Stegostoma tigrinum TaxID=3053191 RepID=UPI00202B1CCD|nr:protein CBFA2T1-like [Stegostoma tigrinum]XP_048402174.1 protein CBFA2T1-like [Stegostoma tigrinum]XP_048402175.1 protein CBFA2T1-like [Stegostoma tigrinum]XP_048402176.1 protein CBFA2T1-like [Stegostoma tigrinum]XP_048402177.1 protein CBFA2T1-like [Stegostoma tigrinum]
MNENSQSPTINRRDLSTPNGFSNGPATSTSSSPSYQQFPPSCGARQLCKLKRFLTTLQQFASDLSLETGEYVRNLVLGLVDSTWTIEEFHTKLQEATNFPLRPFVIPFLKANLPLLQQELLHCARLAKQTPAQYLAQHEKLLLKASSSLPIDSSENVLEVNENGKRRTPARTNENRLVCDAVYTEQLRKRACRLSPGHSFHPRNGLNNQANALPHQIPSPPQHCRLEELAVAHQHTALYRHPENRHLRDRQQTTAPGVQRSQSDVIDHHLTDREWAEEWKHLDNLLNCIMDMVEKTRHSLMVLRRCQEADRVELHHWICHYRNSDDMRTEVHGQILQGQGYIQEEIWKKAEEAVNEVKRQAMTELKKAVLEAEHTAHKMVTAERVKMECALTETKQQVSEAIQSPSRQQEAASEGCWNCGQKASETCSGCNMARYCDSFCQHKHWEKHHRLCGHNIQHLQSINTAVCSHNAVSPAPSPSATSGRDNPVTPSPSPSATSGRDNPVTPSPSPSATSGRDNAATPSPSPSATSGRDNPVTPSPSPSVTLGRDNLVTPSPSPSVISGRDNPVTPSPSPSATSGRDNAATPSPSPSATSGRDNPVAPSPSPSVTLGRDSSVSPSPSPSVTSGRDNAVTPSPSSGRDNPITPFTSPLLTSGRDNPMSPSPSTFPAVTSGKDNIAFPWTSSSQQIHPVAVASGSDTGSTNAS